MDVLITRVSLRQIEALFLEENSTCGLLMGHQRGPRIIIESIFPLPGVMGFTLDKLFQLTRVFGPDFIGFFTTKSGEMPSKQILSPFAAGMLFSRLDQENSEMDFYQIEYNGKFYLKKLDFFHEEPI